ncbi:hypothetical protein IJJ18_01025 [Candidatus Saccharibacteria bacterium]|nr:hypothetical protein [Candidatus Saccharibacteria bacterium]
MSCYFDCVDDRLKEKFLYSLAEKRLERGLSTGLLAKAFWTEDRHKHFRKEWCKDVASDLYSRINESNFDLVAWSKSLIPKFKLDYVGMYELGYFNGDSSKIAEDAYRLTTQSEWQIAS